MNKSDLLVISMVVLIISIHLAAVIIQFFTNKLLYLVPLLNIVAGLFVLIYWTQKQLSIRQHFFDTREIMVLCFEAIVVGCAVYCIVHSQWNNWLKVLQYLFIAIHVSVLLLFLVFMLSFKMNKLF